VDELRQTHPASWLKTTYQAARRSMAPPTLFGVAGAILALALLLIPPMPWDVRLPFYLIVLIWTILRPRLALYLMAFAVPWGSLDYISAGHLRLNSADILVAFLAIGWLMSWVLPASMGGGRDRERGRVPLYLGVATASLIGVMFLSMTVAISKADSLKEIAKWLEFIVLLLLGAQYLRTRRQVWTLVLFIIAAAITQSFFGYAQAIFSLGPASFIRSSTLRVYGTFDQPNPYAGYLNMSLVVVLAVFLLGRDWLTRFLSGIATCLIGGALFLTQSRGSQIALLAALTFIILVGFPGIRAWMRVVIIGICTAIGGMLGGFIPLSAFGQVEHFLGLNGISLQDPTSADYSTAERLAHWIAGLRMYLTHPVLGVGIGNYPDAYANYYVTIFVNSLGQAHNYYINIAAETGTIGLVVYLFFVVSMLIAGGRAVSQVSKQHRQVKAELPQGAQRIPAPLERREKVRLLTRPLRFAQYYRRQERFELFGKLTNDRALVIGLMAAIITICVHNLVDDLYDHGLTNLMALLLIALIASGRIALHMKVASQEKLAQEDQAASHPTREEGSTTV